MRSLLSEDRFDFIVQKDKDFILSFDEAIQTLGYSCGGEIGSGYCWGKYMIIYFKTGVKAKKVAARIYLRDQGIVLRLFFHQVDDHRDYIENAPEFIKNVFMEGHGDCHRCENKPDGVCGFRKAYTINDRRIEKCSGVVFEFWEPSLEKLPGYISLLEEFYPVRNRKSS